jgi:hypothetical protein
MTAELSRLAPEIVIVGLVCIAFVAAILAVQWGRVRRHEAELDFTRQLVEQGLPVDEIERLLAHRHPPTKGLLEQFNALGRGSKAGIIFVALVGVSLIGNAIQMCAIWAGRP